MRIKNQLKLKKLVATLPEGVNHYRAVKRLVEGKSWSVDRAFNYYLKK